MGRCFRKVFLVVCVENGLSRGLGGWPVWICPEPLSCL